MWHGAEFQSPFLNFSASILSDLFYNLPILDKLASLSTMLIELLYPLTLVIPSATLVIPVSMTAIHISIFLGSGISFHALGLSALAIVVPALWRAPTTSKLVKFTDWRVSLAFLVAITTAVTPAILGYHIHPFSNHHQFGWHYAGVRTSGPVFSAGVLKTDGSVVQMPMEYGGFMGFRHFSDFQAALGELFSSVSPNLPSIKTKLHIACGTLSTYRANSRRLGIFSYPEHMITAPTDLGRLKKENLVAIKRTITWNLNKHFVETEVLTLGADYIYICLADPTDIWARWTKHRQAN